MPLRTLPLKCSSAPPVCVKEETYRHYTRGLCLVSSTRHIKIQSINTYIYVKNAINRCPFAWQGSNCNKCSIESSFSPIHAVWFIRDTSIRDMVEFPKQTKGHMVSETICSNTAKGQSSFKNPSFCTVSIK